MVISGPKSLTIFILTKNKPVQCLNLKVYLLTNNKIYKKLSEIAIEIDC